MEIFDLIVNGEKKTSVKCEASQVESFTKILSQLGRYAAFHGYNFQFFHEQIEQ